MTVYVIHENPDWFPPFAAAFEQQQIPYQEWLLGEGHWDLQQPPPKGIFWSRMSASSHSRGHIHAKDHTRAVLAWLTAHQCQVVNGESVLELEMSKIRQTVLLQQAGFDVPHTVAVIGQQAILEAARSFTVPFIIKHNQGGKGIGVQKIISELALQAYLQAEDYYPPVDGITLLQEYCAPHDGWITRVEIVGYQFLYALQANAAEAGFQLCPADVCAVGPAFCPTTSPSAGQDEMFKWYEHHPHHDLVQRYLQFCQTHQLAIAGFEYIETADNRLVTYDINTNTNYNPEVERRAPRSGPAEIVRYLGNLL